MVNQALAWFPILLTDEVSVRVASDVSAAADVAADEADPEVVGGVAFGASLLGHKLRGLE